MKKTLLGPFLLIVLGIIFLLNNFGILPWEVWIYLWKFWPVVLILVAFEILIGLKISTRIFYLLLFLIFVVPIILVLNPITGNSLAKGEIKLEKPLGSLTKANLDYELSSNSLEMKALPADSILAIKAQVKYSQTTAKPTANEEVHFNQAKFSFTSSSTTSIPLLSGLGGSGQIELSSFLPFDITVKAGNGEAKLDFSKVRVDSLEYNATAGSLDLIFSKDYASKAFIKTATGLITITIPKELEARVKLDSVIKSVNIDSKRFVENSGEYKTSGFDKAEKKIDIEISTSAASLTVK